MDARHVNFLEFIKDARQFRIPIYQRKYSWERAQCEQLWRDIINAGKSQSAGGHFVGSIVYVSDTDATPAPVLVIDGQQRLTTMTLLIAALAEAVGDETPTEGFSKAQLEGYYLKNPLETGERARKMVLTETDRDTLFAIVDNIDLPDDSSARIVENQEFFKKCLSALDGNYATVCNGLSKLLIVYVALSRRDDNPQLIFESMNSTGRELSQSDLIRNFVLMGLEPDLQTRLYSQHWRPMERAFGQEDYDDYFDGFMRHYLTLKTGKIPKIREVYAAFKDYARSDSIRRTGIETLVADVRKFSKHYCAMALDFEEDAELKKAFRDLKALKVDVAYPFLLELYSDYEGGALARVDFLEILRLIESYVFRRAVCEIPTNSLNKTFSTFGKELDKDCYFESIKAHFLLMPSYRRFPSDEEFMREFCQRDLYNFKNRTYWLRRFENHDRNEHVAIEEHTIEHIMPQNENLTEAWRNELGEDWKRIHGTYLHKLGNLTLTGYNSQYSDKPFVEKRDMPNGFRHSPLRINEGLGQVERWSEEVITNRANRLAKAAVGVWGYPDISPEVLETYRKDEESFVTNFTREDHPFLMNSPTGELFDAFRDAVLNLDPCVTEEIRRKYIAYKAERNFVDVVPQAHKLRLAINMKFVDIHDPRRICRDVTNVGHWGNGDVRVVFRSLEDLPYIIGLVRQSLEQQMGDSAGE